MIVKYFPTEVKINKSNTIETIGALYIEGEKFLCNSGVAGNGTIPHGVYKLGSYKVLAKIKDNNPYMGKKFPWYVVCEPMFKTTRTGLLIHPDVGGYYGTLGCVGVMEDDEKAFNLLKKMIDENGQVKMFVY